jgi:DNA-binding winged helix-turn-helix (wHTH) protein
MSRPLDPPAVPGPFRVGDWMVDPELNRVSTGDTLVQLEIRFMQVLVYLAERAGSVVPRKELFDAVWATEYVSDNALTHAIAELRKALGDSAREPAYIETVQRRGYRLIAPVSGFERADRVVGERVACWLISGASTIPLAPGETVIGRAADADVVIESPKVSRRHARVVVDGGRAVIEDLGSTNGTSVNGSRIEGPRELLHGDEILIGRGVQSFRFACNSPDAETVESVAKPSTRRPI